MKDNEYILSGYYLDGSSYFERLPFSEAQSTIDWIFRTNNNVYPFGSKSTVINYKTLTVEIDNH